jgi:CheY-like chemotaxis protein
MSERRAEVVRYCPTHDREGRPSASGARGESAVPASDTAHAEQPARRPRLLCLEQTRAGQQIMQGAFEAAGYEVAFAETAHDLPALVESLAPHVILLEMNLKVGRGDEVCRHLKRKAVKLIPIVLVAGIPEEELMRRARAAGADRHYCKSRGVRGLVDLVDDLTSEILF